MLKIGARPRTAILVSVAFILGIGAAIPAAATLAHGSGDGSVNIQTVVWTGKSQVKQPVHWQAIPNLSSDICIAAISDGTVSATLSLAQSTNPAYPLFNVRIAVDGSTVLSPPEVWGADAPLSFTFVGTVGPGLHSFVPQWKLEPNSLGAQIGGGTLTVLYQEGTCP